MKGDFIILNGTVFTRGRLQKADIVVRDGKIAEIGNNPDRHADAQIIDASGMLVSSGFVDLHVHFREPGFEYKETIKSGSLAAARGGYTTVCAMPNLSPVPDSLENIAIEQNIIDRDAVVEVLPYASITKERKGLELTDMAALKDKCAGFSDDGSGVQSDAVMLEAMKKAAELGCIIAAHCEDTNYGDTPRSEWGQIERDLQLCEKTGCRYHVCHISTRRSVELIRDAKSRGVKVTCETGPHYLTLCEDDVLDEGRFRMNPPLRGADDRIALVEGLADGTIDAVATDHAPHSVQEKARGFAGSNMGIVGLETAFPVLYTRLVKSGAITLERLLEALTEGPRRAFGLGGGLQEGAPADITIVNLDQKFRIDSSEFLSMGHSTPFEGMEVYGRVKMTFKNGNPVWKDNS